MTKTLKHAIYVTEEGYFSRLKTYQHEAQLSSFRDYESELVYLTGPIDIEFYRDKRWDGENWLSLGPEILLSRVWGGDIEACRAAAKSKVEGAAARERSKSLTTFPGQDMIYKMKSDEAWAIQNGDADPTPILDAESSARGITRNELASLVLQKEAETHLSMADIEAKRARFKDDIEQLSTFVDIDNYINSMTF